MSPEALVADRLAAWPAIVSQAGGRVWQVKLPQTPTLPAVVVQLVVTGQDYHLRGDQLARRSIVQVDAYVREQGDWYAAADALGEAVRAALSGAVFDDGGSPPTRCTGAFLNARRVLYEAAADLRLVRVSQDFVVWTTT